jgi:poly(hydroxyalkanoate) granule-associated protein
MAKKLKDQTKSDDIQLSKAVRVSAQQIWQAGLGAFAKAQQEGGKAFSKLVKDGSEFQKRTQTLAEEKVSDVSDKVARIAENVSKKAASSWDKLEQVFEDRVARALGNLGTPTQQDMQTLAQSVEKLSKQLAELSGNERSAPAAAPEIAAKARKTSARPATIQKSSAKPAARKSATKIVAAKSSRTKLPAK